MDDAYQICLMDASGARPDLLSTEERQRLATFEHEGRRLSFVLGRTAARLLLAEALDVAPEAAPLAVETSGAPVVAGAAFHISIAHAGRGEPVGGAALSRDIVGLDLERIVPRNPGLWRRILAPEEHVLLEELGGPSDRTQTLLWSLKEAVLKARKTGLRAGTRSVVLRDLDFSRQRLRATDTDGGLWRLSYERRGDVWVTVALAER